ncbi:hypothetical protein GCM10027589_17080 [Actinocorallia lasiicapitis]
MPLSPRDPFRIGAYRPIGRVGEGSQGVVYQALAADGRLTAVKVPHAELLAGPNARARFEREVLLTRRVASFCTARVLDADVKSATPFIVSEYIEGSSLKEHLAGRAPLSGTELFRFAVSLAAALAAIHDAGVVHRDVKPANVLLGPDGPRVIDFGIARALNSMAEIEGTPAYMAPERMIAAPANPASDVWAWACVVAYAANGCAPFGHDGIIPITTRVAATEPALGAITGRLRETVMSCLAKNPAARPSSRELLLRLLGIPEPPPNPCSQPHRVFMLGFTLGSGSALSMLALTSGLLGLG